MKFETPTPPTIKLPFKAICIDSTNKPPEIPLEKWLKQDDWYTVINVKIMGDGSIGFIIKEITLGEECYPYKAFGAYRFGIPMDPKGAEGAMFEQQPETLWQDELLPS